MYWGLALGLAAQLCMGCSLLIDTDDLDGDNTPGGDAGGDNVIFADGFENGLVPWTEYWVAAPDVVQPSTREVRDGSQSLHCQVMETSDGPTAAYYEFAPGQETTEINIRQWLYLDEGFDSSELVGVMSTFRGEGVGPILDVWLESREVVLKDELNNQALYTGIAVPLDQWFELEIFMSSKEVGRVAVRLDGVDRYSQQVLHDMDYLVEAFATCMIWQHEGTTRSLFIDDVVLIDGPF